MVCLKKKQTNKQKKNNETKRNKTKKRVNRLAVTSLLYISVKVASRTGVAFLPTSELYKASVCSSRAT